MPDNESITAGGMETGVISKPWENKDMEMLLQQAGNPAGMSLFLGVWRGWGLRAGGGSTEDTGKQGAVGAEWQLRAGIPHGSGVVPPQPAEGTGKGCQARGNG